jgi:DNA protecting protein DprA
MSELATLRTTDELQVAYSFWLSQLTYLTPQAAFKFREKFPTFESWESLSASDRRDAASTTLGEKEFPKVLATNFDSLIDRALKDVKTHKNRGIRVVSIHSPLYPELLKKIPDPPLILFVRGAIEALIENTNVAVIGTRDTTPTGEKVATRIAKWLGEHNWSIVSGLAKGIDTAAHRGALDANARTIAVMAMPLDKVYPAENRGLANEILKRGGCWVSEMALFKKPHRGSFVQRDRIQSGLSVAVIPVQTDVEGGTMHTVRYAEEQKRLLLCPRPIDLESSLKQYAGIKRLIESQRAKPFAIDQYNEILDVLSKSRVAILGAGFSKVDSLILTAIEKDHIAIVDEPEPKPKQTKPKKARRKPLGRLQVDFGFVAELEKKPAIPKKRAKKFIEAEIEVLEQLVFEVEQFRNPDGTSLSNVDQFKAWLESKIKTLKQA